MFRAFQLTSEGQGEVFALWLWLLRRSRRRLWRQVAVSEVFSRCYGHRSPHTRILWSGCLSDDLFLWYPVISLPTITSVIVVGCAWDAMWPAVTAKFKWPCISLVTSKRVTHTINGFSFTFNLWIGIVLLQIFATHESHIKCNIPQAYTLLF